MHVIHSLTLVACVSAGPAIALPNCPAAEDMAGGVRLTFADGAVQVYRAGQDGTVVMDVVEAGGDSFRLELAHGFHVLDYVATSGGNPITGSEVAYDYGMPVAELPVPAPGARWDLTAKVTDNFGTRTERILEVWGDPQRLAIGDCTYDVMDVAVAYGAETANIDQARYLPELKLLFVLNDATTGQPTVPTEISVLTD